MEDEAFARLIEQGFTSEQIAGHRRGLDMRYHGQEHTVRVPWGSEQAVAETTLEAAFHELHRRSYTFALVDTPIEIVNFRTISTIEMPRPSLGRARLGGSDAAGVARTGRRVDFGDGVRRETAIFVRSSLPEGFAAIGPAIVEEASATTVVLPGQRFDVDRFGNLVISAGDPV
jgi:N-methylhydantoinase A